MNRSIHWALAATVALLLGTLPMLAQSDSPQPAEPTQPNSESAAPASQSTQTEGESPRIVRGLHGEGTLKGVDTEERIFLITDENGKEMMFYFDEDTEVLGQTSAAQGLTGQSGNRVRIMYRAEGEKAVAEQIELVENVTSEPATRVESPDPNR